MNELVSLLIPAYNEPYFPAAFASALAQTYAPLEIVVCDDSPGHAIESEVARVGDPRVRYVRNAERRGFAGNFTQCLALAEGDLIKFLNDDDCLRPRCVEVLAAVLNEHPAVTLATSRRVVIDAQGHTLPDTPATQPLAQVSSLMSGIELGNFALVHSVNFIGEPSTVLFRRGALTVEGDSLFRWGEHDYHCLADLSVWLRVLSKGLAYYSAAPLSEYRRHAGQEQNRAEVWMPCLVERRWLAHQARSAGFLAVPAQLRASLSNAKGRAAAWGSSVALGAADRTALETLLGELDRDLASL